LRASYTRGAVKAQLIAALLLLWVTAALGEHVDGYTRKDGKQVAGYERGNTRGTPGSSVASASPASGEDYTTAYVIAAFAGVILLIYIASKVGKRSNSQAQQQHKAQLVKEAEEFSARVHATRRGGVVTFPPVKTSVNLGRDEEAILSEIGGLMEQRSRRRDGVSCKELHEIDRGEITLTSKRLIFHGAGQARVTNVADIVGVSLFLNAFQVATKRRQKVSVYCVRNPLIWNTVFTMLAKGEAGPSQEVLPVRPEPSKEVISMRPPVPPKSPAPIKFDCPSCGQSIEAEADMAGTSSQCPACGGALIVPA